MPTDTFLTIKVFKMELCEKAATYVVAFLFEHYVSNILLCALSKLHTIVVQNR